MKIFRVFRDIKAKSKKDALEKLSCEIDDRGHFSDDTFRIQEDPFDDEEEGTILEMARVALSDAEVYDYFADKLDLSDKELKNLQEKIKTVTDR